MKGVKVLICLLVMVMFGVTSSFAYRSDIQAEEIEREMNSLVEDMMNGYGDSRKTCTQLAEWGILMAVGIVGTVLLIKNRSTHQHTHNYAQTSAHSHS